MVQEGKGERRAPNDVVSGPGSALTHPTPLLTSGVQTCEPALSSGARGVVKDPASR